MMKIIPPLIRNVLVAGMLGLSGFQASAVTPPLTWQEHWFEHDELIERWYYNDNVAIYFDDNTSTASRNTATAWMAPFLTDVWNYTRTTYELGGSEQRLYNIFHTNQYFGGHPDTHFSSKHDYRDVIDIGLGSWTSASAGNKGIILHEISHIVEFSAYDVEAPSPSRSVWKDSKFAEIYNYDTAVGIGDTALAQSFYNSFDDNVDSFPSAGTMWFRNWFYPLWNNYGKTRFLQRYFHLLATNFPTQTTSAGNLKFSRSMTLGEFVYFMSAAARRDMRDQAAIAFDWTSERDVQYDQARADFPEIDPAQPWFMIVNKNSGKAADMIFGNMSNGALVNQWAYIYNSPNQRWSIRPEGNGHYKIVSYVSDRVLGIQGNSTANGAQLISQEYDASNTSQQWDLIHVSNGWFKIQNVRSGKVLDVAASTTADNGKLQQYSDNGTAAQRFRLQPWGDYFVRADSGKYVCIENKGSTNGSPIIQYTRQNSPWFKWRFENATEGYLKVSSLNAPSKVLCVAGGSTSVGADCNLFQYSATNNGSQHVNMIPYTDGKFKFFFTHSGMPWEITGGGTANNVRLEQNTSSSNAYQRFELERVP